MRPRTCTRNEKRNDQFKWLRVKITNSKQRSCAMECSRFQNSVHVRNFSKTIKESVLKYFWSDREESSRNVRRNLILVLSISRNKTAFNLKMCLTYLLILAIFSGGFCDKARFDNYRVYSIKIETEQQLNLLQEFEIQQNEFTFIEAPIAIDTNAEIIVPPHKFADISDILQSYGLKADIRVNNLQRFVGYKYKINHVLKQIYA